MVLAQGGSVTKWLSYLQQVSKGLKVKVDRSRVSRPTVARVKIVRTNFIETIFSKSSVREHISREAWCRPEAINPALLPDRQKKGVGSACK